MKISKVIMQTSVALIAANTFALVVDCFDGTMNLASMDMNFISWAMYVLLNVFAVTVAVNEEW